MPLTDDIAAIARQEAELTFPVFDANTAWQLGTALRELALARGHNIVIDVRRFGNPHQPLFYAALEGTTPDNARWVQRKSNVVARFHRSSYQVGLHLKNNNTTIAEKYALPEADYAAHGGSFPIRVAGAGVIGSVTVSGLPQREDHNLVVEALCRFLNRDHEALRLQGEKT
ncbi:MAG TPA: heme-degrading domain-containing protein [Edaphobacter sp.]|nr:heme-degrading domain-containing protein [Edaphobacter sp.]